MKPKATILLILLFTSGVLGGYKNGDCGFLRADTADVRDTEIGRSEWDVFVSALIWVESKGNKNAKGSHNDGGILQIRPIYVRECNRLLGFEKYTLDDRFDSLKSIEMFTIIQNHYNPEKDIEKAIYYHNKNAPESYKKKIMSRMELIKNNEI